MFVLNSSSTEFHNLLFREERSPLPSSPQIPAEPNCREMAPAEFPQNLTVKIF